jgi:hydrogenase expression/formation protein HypC
MCLGVPGRVTEIFREDDLLMGKVDFGGISKRVCLEHTPEVQAGNYVIVHVGFSLSQVDAEEAKKIFQFLKDMNELRDLDDSVS